jgi:lipoic acid synthetase
MLGLGERGEEVTEALTDLRSVDCDMVTLGQYLQPTPRQMPVVGFVAPERFDELGRVARQLGFISVTSGPLVRSSYHAEALAPLPVSQAERQS